MDYVISEAGGSGINDSYNDHDKSSNSDFQPELVSDYFFNEPTSPVQQSSADNEIIISSPEYNNNIVANEANQHIQQWPVSCDVNGDNNSSISKQLLCQSPESQCCESPECIPQHTRHTSAQPYIINNNNIQQYGHLPINVNNINIESTPSPQQSQPQSKTSSPNWSFSPIVTNNTDPNTEYVGPFKLGAVLGRGCTGTVRLGTHKYTGFEVAFKIIDKKYLNSDNKLWKKVKREIVILKLIEHPNILKLYDILETKTKLYLVLEHVSGGELFDYIVSKGRLDRHESLRLTAQIVMGLEHCHIHSICHRDLKPENLLLDKNHNIKIADFGMAQLMKPTNNTLKTSCGSPHYASPEIIEGHSYDARKTDVWSIGVILYALITGSLPFDHDNIPTLLQMVCKGQYHTPSYVPKDIADLISRMLTVDPNKRILLEHIKEHTVYKNAKFDYFNVRNMNSKFDTMNNNDHAVPQKRKVKNATVNHIKRQHGLSIDSNDVSISPNINVCIDTDSNSDTDSDSDNDSGGLEEQVLKDLESLGWGNKDELREKVLKQYNSNNPTIEREFYKLLKKRRNARLQQLSVLSPKVPLYRAESAPATMRHSAFFNQAMHHHHHSNSLSSAAPSPSTQYTSSPYSMSTTAQQTPAQTQLQAHTIDYSRTPSSVYATSITTASPSMMPSLMLTPQTGPTQYNKQNITTITQRPVMTINQAIIAEPRHVSSHRMPSFELSPSCGSAAAVYQRMANTNSSNSSSSDNDSIKHPKDSDNKAVNNFKAPQLSLANDDTEDNITMLTNSRQSSETLQQSNQQSATVTQPSSRRLFEQNRGGSIDDSDTSMNQASDNNSEQNIAQTQTQQQSQQRIPIRIKVPHVDNVVYRSSASTPKYKVTESPRFHRLHYTPITPNNSNNNNNSNSNSDNSTPISSASIQYNDRRHKSVDYGNTPVFIRQSSMPYDKVSSHSNVHTRANSISIVSTPSGGSSSSNNTNTGKKKSWFSSLFGRSTLDTLGKTKHIESTPGTVQRSTQQQNKTNINSVTSIENNNGVCAAVTNKQLSTLIVELEAAFNHLGLLYTKSGSNKYLVDHNSTVTDFIPQSTPVQHRSIRTAPTTVASTPAHSHSHSHSHSKPPKHNRRSTLPLLNNITTLNNKSYNKNYQRSDSFDRQQQQQQQQHNDNYYYVDYQ